MSNGVQTKNVSGNPFDIFVIGARKGFNIAINNLVPNILMAYAVAEILNLLGVMSFLGNVFGPGNDTVWTARRSRYGSAYCLAFQFCFCRSCSQHGSKRHA